MPSAVMPSMWSGPHGLSPYATNRARCAARSASGTVSSPASTTTTRTLRSSVSFSATTAAVMPDPMMQMSLSMTSALP
jgi:hypothetical protein